MRQRSDNLTQGASGNRAAVLAAFLIVFAGLAAYSNSLGVPFVLDDLASIVHNETIRQFWPPGKMLAPPEGTTVSGRPLLNVTLALNYACGGLSVWGYHALNLAVHLLAGLTLFGIVRRTLARNESVAASATDETPARSAPVTERAGVSSVAEAMPSEALAKEGARLSPNRSTAIAFAAALLWTVHPLQTQAVTYVVQRAESMMALFYLLTIYCFIRSVDVEGGTKAGRLPPPDRSGTRRRFVASGSPSAFVSTRWMILSVLACLLGMATKEVMATAPVMLLLYDRTFVAGTFREAWLRRWGFYLALAATWVPLGWLVASTGGNRSGTSGFDVGVSPWGYWLTQFGAAVHYLRLSFWPYPQVFEYGTFWVRPPAAAPAAIAVTALAAGAVFAFFGRGMGARALGFAGAWFFGILSVTSGVPGIYQMIVEHRMYLPLAVITTGAAVGLWRGGGSCALPASLALAVGLGGLTHHRNRDYASAISLWQDTVDRRPENETAQTSLAVALFNAGRAPEAVTHYEAALRLKPEATDTLNDLGCALLSLGRTQEGILRLEQAVHLEPAVPQYRFNLGNGLAGANRLEEAIVHFREAIRLEPAYAEAHLKLALALWLTGRQDEAIAERAEGLRLQGGR